MTHVSLEALARFSVLPGAAELIEAFSLIPPGPMRDAVLHLAQTTAATYQGAPAAKPYKPDFIAPATGRQGAQPRLGRSPPTESPQALAVKLKIENPDITTTQIIARTGLTKQQVYQAMFAARKAGAPIKKNGTRAKKGAPASDRVAKGWPTSLDEISPASLVKIQPAADARGITVEAYLKRRQLALQMAMDGASYDRILKATGETDQKTIATWLSTARSAGYRVPYVTSVTPVPHEAQEDAQEPQSAAPEPITAERVQEAPEEPQEAPEPPAVASAAPTPATGAQTRYFDIDMTMRSNHIGAARAAIQKGAETRGITVEAYQDLRERIVALRIAGESPLAIQMMTACDKQFVRDTLRVGVERGAVYPPLKGERAAA